MLTTLSLSEEIMKPNNESPTFRSVEDFLAFLALLGNPFLPTAIINVENN